MIFRQLLNKLLYYIIFTVLVFQRFVKEIHKLKFDFSCTSSTVLLKIWFVNFLTNI